MAEMITFELIRRIQREEQKSAKPTKLPDNFFESVKNYLDYKKRISEGNRMVSLEIKSIERLIEDIYNRRERKISSLALINVRTRIEPENLTEDEKIYFDRLVMLIKERRDNTLKKILEKEIKKIDTLRIVFNEDVREFVGIDMKTYGPFKKGETAELPELNAKIFVERNIAEVRE